MAVRRWWMWSRRYRRVAMWVAGVVLAAGVTWLAVRWWPSGDRPGKFFDRSSQVVTLVCAVAGVLMPFLAWRRPVVAPPDQDASTVGRPRVVGIVPRAANSLIPRAVAAQVEQALTEGNAAILTQVLSGLGGVGKTQLAAAVARSWREKGQADLLVWITATSPDSILSGYAQAGVEVADGDPADDERAARRFVAWLAETPRRWLIVLDDLTVPADLQGWWPPESPLGRVIVTTRRRDAALQERGRFVTVDVFTPAEAEAYLTTKSLLNNLVRRPS
jgi:hypothetical protein